MSGQYVCWRCCRIRHNAAAAHLARRRADAADLRMLTGPSSNLRPFTSTTLLMQGAYPPGRLYSSSTVQQGPAVVSSNNHPRGSPQIQEHQPASNGSRQSTRRAASPTSAAKHRNGNTRIPLADSKSSKWAGSPFKPGSYDHLLQDLVTDDRTPLEIWHRLMASNAFQSSSLPESLEVNFRRSPKLKSVFRLFLRTSIYKPPEAFPSLTEVMATFLNRGLFRYSMLADVLNIARPKLSLAVYGQQSWDQDAADDKLAVHVLSGILNAWRLTLGSVSHQLLASENANPQSWEGLPDEEELQMVLASSSDYLDQFKNLFGGRLDTRVEQKVAADSAWVYLAYKDLESRGKLSEEQTAAWMPWKQLMARLLDPYQNLRASLLQDILKAASTVVGNGTLRIATLRFLGRESTHPKNGTSVRITDPATPDSATTTYGPEATSMSEDVMDWRSRLIGAIKHADDGRVQRLWYQVQDASGLWPAEDVSAVLREFLWAFARLRQADMAATAWRVLKQRGIKPRAGHWDAMIEAAKQVGDLQSLEGIWSEMVKSGQRPSNQAWTAFIAALSKLRAPGRVFEAVAAMDKQWRASTREPPSALPRDDYLPSMFPINAAISGLLAMDRSEGIDALLQTAREHRLQPRTDTFNILLQDAARRQDSSGMQKIFNDMKTAQCEPDVITFTLVIDSLLRPADSPLRIGSLEEQQEAINDLFADLAAAGLEPSGHTYTTLLRALLEGDAPNLPAARAVLQRMEDQGIGDQSYAYTVLARHFFTRQPPDLEAVEQLRQKARRSGLQLDAWFYDYLVQGFAEAGEHDRTLSALGQVAQPGRLRIRTAHAVLALFVRTQDRLHAAELVRNVERDLAVRVLPKADRLEMPRWMELVRQLRAEGWIATEPMRVPLRRIAHS